MVSSIAENNLFLINAPAGSGKTTLIKDKITEIALQNPDLNILCITYTNRAADELLSKINSKNVEIKTIHSFISDFVGLYFSNNEVINLFFEIYKDEINARIENTQDDPNIKERNVKYIEENGPLTFETLKHNTKKLQYNQLSFNSYYKGGLSHDELLKFAKILIDKYPIIKKRVSSKYQYIFIDEYQDTSAEVLKFFNEAVSNTTTKLYLMGDRMQQIYKNYDGSFEDELKQFDTRDRLVNNYRSVKNIVDILNNIYNCDALRQEAKREGNLKIPTICLTNSVELKIAEIEATNPNILKLFIANRKRFETIGAINLFNSINNMERYSYISKYGAVDVLTTNNNDNPDPLFRLLFDIQMFLKYFSEKKYGLLIQKIKDKSNKYYDKNILKINIHEDKKTFKNIIEDIFKQYNSDCSIREFLDFCKAESFIDLDAISDLMEENSEYKDLLQNPLSEFRNLIIYLDTPNVSTQHGVKGEGHNSVLFLAENSGNPPVKMYDFFKLFSQNEINYLDFEDFYYNYIKHVELFEKEMSIKISAINKDSFISNKDKIDKFIELLLEKYSENIYFKFFFYDRILKYKDKPGVGSIKDAIKPGDVFGVLVAYKLFYVGCSRAKEHLIVVVKKNDIEAFEENFKTKMKSIGFSVEY